MNMIEEWGKWARHHKDDLGSQSSWLLVMRNNIELHRCPNYRITDDEALKVDMAVSKLAKHSVVLLNVLCYKYLAGWSPRDIAKNYLTVLEYGINSKKQVGKETAYQLLARAEGYVLGVVENS